MPNLHDYSYLYMFAYNSVVLKLSVIIQGLITINNYYFSHEIQRWLLIISTYEISPELLAIRSTETIEIEIRYFS